MAPARSQEKKRCPLCGERTDARFLRRHAWLEGRVVRRLREAHASWRREHGACPRCVSWALEKLHGRGGPDAGREGREGDLLSLAARLPSDPNVLGRGVSVAVIDSDFVFHPEFLEPRPRVLAYIDARGAKPRAHARPPEPYVGSWHGTMVAGAGFGSGVTGAARYPGLATASKLVLVSILGEGGRVGERQVLQGLQWVLSHHQDYGIRVVNLSVGADEPRPSRRSRLDRLVERAARAGLVVVAAAGNRPERKPVAPASSAHAITVGGVNDLGRAAAEAVLYGYSHGPTLDGIPKPDLLAPGIWVPAPMVPGTPQWNEAAAIFALEAMPDALLAPALVRRNGALGFPVEVLEESALGIRAALAARRVARKYITPHHQHVDGTSFSAAIVSAVAAQILEVNPRLRPEEVRACLVHTASPLHGIPRDVQGAGVVHPFEAVQFARVLGGEEVSSADLASPVLEGSQVVLRFHDATRRLQQVEWAGSLGGWAPQAMRRVRPGLFEIARPAPPPGRHPYKFLLPDGRWTADPRNREREPDGFGGWNSVLVVRRR